MTLSTLRHDPGLMETVQGTDDAESSPEVTVLMPCLNEATTLGTCIRKAQRAMTENRIDGEVLVADNGSTDGSVEIAERAGARIVRVVTKGYGSALAAGIAASRGKYVVMGDADDSYDFEHVTRFLSRLREGEDLVMGNRFLGGIERGAMPLLHRYVGNPVLSGIGRLLFHSPCRDFHCGMRGFNRKSILKLNLRTPGMEFASEMVVKATLHRLRITEVPTTLSPDGRNRPPHLRSVRDGWRHLRFMLLFSPRWLFFYPGVSLILMGIIGMALLLSRPRAIGSITFDVNSLLYAAGAALVGFEAVLFAIMSRVFAITTGIVPSTTIWTKLFKWFTMEAGIAVGLSCCAAGVCGTLLAISIWDSNSFGPLHSQHMLRIVIPSVLNLVLGCQIVMASVFLSILRLQKT